MPNLLKRVISSILLGSIVIFLIFKGDIYFNILLTVCFLCGSYEIIKLKRLFSKIIIFLIFLIFIFSSYNLRNLNNGLEYLYLVITITWLSDIGGYIFGKYIGGKKINVISPNKTYTGFLGSLILSQFSFIVLKIFNLKLFENFAYTSILFLASSIMVIIGDLTFSYFKRIEKLKDYSNLIPGHGGIFDRIDGLIFIMIFFNIFLQL